MLALERFVFVHLFQINCKLVSPVYSLVLVLKITSRPSNHGLFLVLVSCVVEIQL